MSDGEVEADALKDVERRVNRKIEEKRGVFADDERKWC